MYDKFVKNPFNYHGGKYRLLDQILPLFPKNIDVFVDLFGGSGEVGLNVECNKVIYNEKSEQVVGVMKSLKCENFLDDVRNTIKVYELSKTNREGFLRLREKYNRFEENDYWQSVFLYCIICHSFNNTFAFNSKKEYNMNFGENKSSFNKSLEDKLIKYIERINIIDISFTNKDFNDVDLNKCKENMFFYCDCPYILSCAGYERDYNCKWNMENELKLLELLDKLNAKGIKFALSNVIEHKGKSNDVLKEWAKNYNIHYLDCDYSNCNYQTKDKSKGSSIEVLITNYD